jgi:hypothetical protein
MTDKIRVYDIHSTIPLTTEATTDVIDNIISSLQSAKQAFTNGEWTDLIFDFNEADYYDVSRFHIRGYRWETDLEYQKRMKELEKAAKLKNKLKKDKEESEKKLKKDKEEREKKQYERLKKKYGDK